MLRGKTLIAMTVALGLLGAGPVLAKTAKKTHTVPCKQIKEAIAGGKSEDDVVKELHTTAAHVKHCTAPPAPKHHAAKKAS